MILKAALAALVAAAPLLAAGTADAKTRLRFQVFPQYEPEPDDYYAGPLVAPRPRYYYYYNDEPDDDYAYEPDYYEPDYVEPEPRVRKRPRTVAVRRAYEEPVVKKPLRKKQAAIRKPVRKAVDTRTTASTEPVAKKPKKAAKAEPQQASGKLIPCSKASGIVIDYGFTNVKSTDCQGQSYAFNATRDGKPYVIKLNSVSGELTEVARQ